MFGSGEVILITNGMGDVMEGKAMVAMVVTIYHSIRTQTCMPQLPQSMGHLEKDMAMAMAIAIATVKLKSEHSKHKSISYQYIH